MKDSLVSSIEQTSVLESQNNPAKSQLKWQANAEWLLTPFGKMPFLAKQ